MKKTTTTPAKKTSATATDKAVVEKKAPKAVAKKDATTTPKKAPPSEKKITATKLVTVSPNREAIKELATRIIKFAKSNPMFIIPKTAAKKMGIVDANDLSAVEDFVSSRYDISITKDEDSGNYKVVMFPSKDYVVFQQLIGCVTAP